MKTKENKEADTAVLNLFRALRRLIKRESEKLSDDNLEKLKYIMGFFGTTEEIAGRYLDQMKSDKHIKKHVGIIECYFVISKNTTKELLETIIPELRKISQSKDFDDSVLLSWSQQMRDAADEEKRKLKK